MSRQQASCGGDAPDEGCSFVTGAGRFVAPRVAALAPVASYDTGLLAAERRRSGGDVLPIYGSPWWAPPAHVVEAAREAAAWNVPAPAPGLPELREAVRLRLHEDSGVEVDAERGVIVTNAANHALSIAFATVLEPGDEVLTYAPHYYYRGLVELAGGTLRVAETRDDQNWKWDASALRESVTPRTKVLVVNTPTNPTGWVASEQDLQQAAAVAEEHDLLIVSDEAYDHTIYHGARHISIASLPEATDRTLTVLSCTKSYAMRAWRLGFLAGPSQLVEPCSQGSRWNVFGRNHVAAVRRNRRPFRPSDVRGRDRPAVRRVSRSDGRRPRRSPGGAFVVRADRSSFSRARTAGTRRGVCRTLLLDHGIPTDQARHWRRRPAADVRRRGFDYRRGRFAAPHCVHPGEGIREWLIRVTGLRSTWAVPSSISRCWTSKQVS